MCVCVCEWTRLTGVPCYYISLQLYTLIYYENMVYFNIKDNLQLLEIKYRDTLEHCMRNKSHTNNFALNICCKRVISMLSKWMLELLSVYYR